MESPRFWNLLTATLSIVDLKSPRRVWAFAVVQGLVRDDPGDRETFLRHLSEEWNRDKGTGPSVAQRLTNALTDAGLVREAGQIPDPWGREAAARLEALIPWGGLDVEHLRKLRLHWDPVPDSWGGGEEGDLSNERMTAKVAVGASEKMDRDKLFAIFPVIETERCVLREVPPRCADDLFRIRSQPEGARYGPEVWSDPAKASSRIREWHKWFLDKEDIPWGIFLRGEEKLIGQIKYAYMRQYLGMIGYHLDTDYWNKGIMSEVLTAVVDFLYERTDAHRLQATVHSNHVVSKRVLEKIGFRREGLLRDRAYWHGRFCDLYMYALLRENWQDGRERSS